MKKKSLFYYALQKKLFFIDTRKRAIDFLKHELLNWF